MAECAIRVRPQAQARAAPGGICRRVPGGETDHRPPLWRVAMMGDIGEEITEIELEPFPEESPPAEAPTEPATEPGPG